jgi:hypothetical protein
MALVRSVLNWSLLYCLDLDATNTSLHYRYLSSLQRPLRDARSLETRAYFTQKYPNTTSSSVRYLIAPGRRLIRCRNLDGPQVSSGLDSLLYSIKDKSFTTRAVPITLTEYSTILSKIHIVYCRPELSGR